MTSYVSKLAYCTVAYANTFVSAEYPSLSVAWQALSEEYRLHYLVRASDKIDFFTYISNKSLNTQVREFPRDAYPYETGVDAGDIPTDVLNATCIIALVVWSNEGGITTVDGLIDVESKVVTSESMGSASWSYAISSSDKFAKLDIPEQASYLLKRYLNNWRVVPIGRS